MVMLDISGCSAGC